MKLKLNHAMRGYDVGRIVDVETDREGVPLDKFWRRRLKDAEIDNCVEVITPSKVKQEMDK